MHGISPNEANARETRAVSENGERLASNGAALGEKGRVGVVIGGATDRGEYRQAAAVGV